MAGINVIFDQNEYIDHGQINSTWHNKTLEKGESWVHTIRLVEVPLTFDDNLFVILKEEDSHTKLKALFLGEDPRNESFVWNEQDHVQGGYRGGHIREEDGKLSVGTPYKAFSYSLSYLGTYIYLNGSCTLRVDELPDGQNPEEYWPVDREDPIEDQGNAQAKQVEYKNAIHRVGGVTGEEVRKGNTAIDA